MLFECKICLEKQPSLVDLVRHWGVHYKDIECEKCDFAFSTSDSLERHVRAVHDNMKDLPSLMYVQDPCVPKEESASAKGLQACDPCDVKTLAVKKHLNLDRSEDLELDAKSSPERIIAAKEEKDPVAVVNDSGHITLLECTKCNHKTNSAKKLRLHLEKFHNRKIYPCDRCRFKAKTIGRLVYHKRRCRSTEQ